MLKKILIVEDDIHISQLLYRYLSKENYICHVMDNGLEVEEWVGMHEPSMVLLDVQLPGVDGVKLCGKIREFSTVPIIMITGKAEESDRLLGLQSGADDYICKPFHAREVVARVAAIFRRVEPGFGLACPPDQEEQTFVLDVDRHQLRADGKRISLTAMQCRLLSLLMENEGDIMSREDIMTALYSDSREVSNRTIDTHIRELRKHISTILDCEVVFSVYGAGYKYVRPGM